MLLALAPAAAQSSAERPSDALSRHLRMLAQNPKSISALMGAGKAALDLGDPQAAITFFARAESQAPRDGRIKMWIGSALVQMQQPRSALKFFADAAGLGVADADLAGERGLAWDIIGETRRAQADYRLALSRGSDPEIARRLALSLAIGGDRAAALRLIEGQRDPAAERTRALVLALTGDAAGARRAVEATMPGAQGAAMAPFLDRLPSLSPADRALAVHLGHFNGDGRSRPADSFAANVLDAGRPDSSQPAIVRPRNPPPQPVSTEPRRRPGADPAPAQPVRTSASSEPKRLPPRASPWDYSRGTVSSTRPRSSAGSEPRRMAEARPAQATTVETAPTASAEPQPEPGSQAEPKQPVALAELAPSSVSAPAEPGFSLRPSVGDSAPAPAAEQPVVGSRLADVAAAIAALPDPETAVSPKVEPAPARAQPARTASASPKKPPAAKPAPPKEPARQWVQVAGGANKAALPRTFAALKGKAPKLLGSRSAWTVPVNATNRLLVGPFADAKEAQAFVNELAKAGLDGFAWTSEAGQKIERLPGK